MCASDCPAGPADGSRSHRARSLQNLEACMNPYSVALKSPFAFLPLSRNVTLACYTRTDMVCAHVAQTRQWEPQLYEILSRVNALVRDKVGGGLPTYIDIGANVGVFTWSMASEGNAVLAFEMMPSNVALNYFSGCANPELQARVSLQHTGVSDTDATCLMISSPTNEGDGVVMCNETRAKYFIDKEGYAVQGRVTLRTLDSLFPQGPPFPAIVKMDVEGHEPAVVRGATRTLSGARRPIAILSEVWRTIDIPSLVETFLTVHGYVGWWVEGKMMLRSREDAVTMHGHRLLGAHGNILFVREDYATILTSIVRRERPDAF